MKKFIKISLFSISLIPFWTSASMAGGILTTLSNFVCSCLTWSNPQQIDQKKEEHTPLVNNNNNEDIPNVMGNFDDVKIPPIEASPLLQTNNQQEENLAHLDQEEKQPQITSPSPEKEHKDKENPTDKHQEMREDGVKKMPPSSPTSGKAPEIDNFSNINNHNGSTRPGNILEGLTEKLQELETSHPVEKKVFMYVSPSESVSASIAGSTYGSCYGSYESTPQKNPAQTQNNINDNAEDKIRKVPFSLNNDKDDNS